MRTTIAIAAAMFGLVAIPDNARADDATRVFPLEGIGLSKKLRTAPKALTAELARATGGTVSDVPIADAAGLLECDIEADSCLKTVAESTGTTRLIFGTVQGVEGKISVVVTLIVFEIGKDRVRKAFALEANGVDAISKELLTAASSVISGDSPATAPQTPPDPTPPPVVEPPAERGPEPSWGDTPLYVWGIAGGGVAFVGTGIALLVNANGIRNDVESAPTETLADLERLQELEDRGELRQQIGDGFVIVGGLAIATGVTLAILHRRRLLRERSAVRIDPVLLRGGAGIAITLEGL